MSTNAYIQCNSRNMNTINFEIFSTQNFSEQPWKIEQVKFDGLLLSKKYIPSTKKENISILIYSEFI